MVKLTRVSLSVIPRSLLPSLSTVQVKTVNDSADVSFEEMVDIAPEQMSPKPVIREVIASEQFYSVPVAQSNVSNKASTSNSNIFYLDFFV